MPIVRSQLTILTVADAATVIAKYNRFAERVDELGLPGDVDAKPILDVSPVTLVSIVLLANMLISVGARDPPDPRRV